MIYWTIAALAALCAASLAVFGADAARRGFTDANETE